MGWVRIDDNAPFHRKQLKAGPAACWLWVCGLAYCQRMATDGFIPTEAVPTLGVPTWKKLVAALVGAGLWHQAEGGYQVHDYLAFNATREERDEKAEARRKRTAKWREKRRDASHTSNGDASPSRHADKAVTLLPLPSPSPSPSHPPPTSNGAAAASGAGGLIVSPLAFERMRQKFAFIGARLRVPHVLHDECRTKLGGHDPHGRLMAWYGELDAAVEVSGEPIPDVFVWLRPKFVQWAQDQAADAEMEKFRRMGQ